MLAQQLISALALTALQSELHNRKEDLDSLVTKLQELKTTDLKESESAFRNYHHASRCSYKFLDISDLRPAFITSSLTG